MAKFIFFILILSSLSFSQEHPVPKIMVHYMPWYQTPAYHGYWGYHWTMNHFNPETILPDGQRDIASHYYPLTGPYDSNDSLILEYQTLLMKISGIDGVLVDWYGIENFWDYGTINESTGKLFEAIKKAGLSFAIVYEDQTIKHMVENGHLSSLEAIAHGKAVMNYLQNNWFTKDEYVKLNNRPVLLTFGPQYFMSSANWTSLFSGLPTAPAFFTLDNRLNTVASGAYPWPPMWKSVNGVLSQTSLNEYFNTFYQNAAGYEYLVTSAFPGFNDIYAEAGVGASYGFLSSQNGATFRSTFQKALDNNPEIIQIVTWNDYGEGTIIEPTVEFGNRYLEIIQTAKDSLDSAFVFQTSNLQLPLRIYNLRKQHAGNEEINAALNRVFDLIINKQIEEAAEIVDSISALTDINFNGIGSPGKFSLAQNYPNPFNPSTKIKFSIPETGNVNLKIFDMLGKETATLIDKEIQPGEYEVEFQSSGSKQLSSGIYFYRLSAGDFVETKKMLFLK